MYFLILGILGLLFGSFLNVVIYRIPLIYEQQLIKDYEELTHREEKHSTFNLAWPPSFCPSCNRRLKWYHNVPIFSYIFLNGRCAFCKAPISSRYPLVEFLSIITTLLAGFCFGDNYWLLTFVIIFSWFLIAVSFIDGIEGLLPDELTLNLLWCGLIFNLKDTLVTLEEAVIGAAVGYLLLWLVAHFYKFVRKTDGLGYGDCKLLAALGGWLGWQNLPIILLLSSTVALITNIVPLFRGKTKLSEPIYFGPYLALGGFITLYLRFYFQF